MQLRSLAEVAVDLIKVSIKQKICQDCMSIDEMRDSSRMKRMKNAADVDCADSETCRA